VVDGDGARQIGEEDNARLERREEQRLTAGVVAGDIRTELADARRELSLREVDVPDRGAGIYDARSRRYRSARRSRSRL
jgi:hypothetical protein